MANIINGSLADVKSQTKPIMVLTTTGKDVYTGIQVLSGTQAAIQAQCNLVMLLDENGNSL